MRELIGVVMAVVAACGGGGTKATTVPENSAPQDCASSAAVITRVLATENHEADSPAVKTEVAKRCTDDKWTAEARTCLLGATTGQALHDCGYRNLTGLQQDNLNKATATLTSINLDRALDEMTKFKDQMCACKDAKCAEQVSDAMTKWSQEMSKRDRGEPPKINEEQSRRAAGIGEDMGKCMQTAMGASLPPAPPLTVTGLDPAIGDPAGGTYVKINGASFTADGARNAKVYFGDKQGTIVRFASDSELIVEAPGGKAGETVDVLIIFEPGGEKKILKAFTFEKPKKKKK